MSKKYNWIVEGAKCKWNDPAITDYPKNKRKEVLNRVFTIVGIKSDNGKIDEDTLNLSLIEASYLVEKDRLDVYEDDILCSISYFIDLLKERNLYQGIYFDK